MTGVYGTRPVFLSNTILPTLTYFVSRLLYFGSATESSAIFYQIDVIAAVTYYHSDLWLRR